MPTSFKFLLKSFFNILCSILQIWYLTSNHLYIDILCYEHSVLFILNFHITEFDLCRDWNVRWCPIFRNTCFWDFLLLLFFRLFLFWCNTCHSLCLMFFYLLKKYYMYVKNFELLFFCKFLDKLYKV